jgi:hypothetical protein
MTCVSLRVVLSVMVLNLIQHCNCPYQSLVGGPHCAGFRGRDIASAYQLAAAADKDIFDGSNGRGRQHGCLRPG